MLTPGDLPPAPAGVAAPLTNAPVHTAPAITQPVWSAPVPKKSVSTAFIFGIIGVALVALVFVAVLAYLALALGPFAVVLCGIIALIPLAVVIIAIGLIDRWEPEPRGALWFGLLWGAAASIALTLIADVGIQIAVYFASNGESTTSELFGAVIQAPVVEEFTKGVGVLLIFFFLRKNFDGPVDGLVYGAVVAAGFAFTENILYFGSALVEEGGIGLGFTFFLRGIMSPFAHVMFTACTGVALGFASRRRGWLPAIGLFFVGLICAMGLHAFWNGMALFVPDIEGFFLVYTVVQVPLFVGAILVVIFLRRAESRVTRMRLQEYADAGWFTAHEVDMLSTGAGRKRAKAWAAARPPAVRRAMKSFIRHATALAFTRNRILIQRNSVAAQVQERVLLDSVLADRAALLPVGGV